MGDNPDFPYSYHTFLFPFIWNDNGNVCMEEFSSILSKKHWVETSWDEEKIPKKAAGRTQEQAKEDYFLDYASYQYFTGAARDVVFNSRGDNVTRVYEFNPDGRPIRNRGQYIITKSYDNPEKSERFELNINGIKLNLYNTGVGIITFELEYRGIKFVDGRRADSRTMDDVDKINEYGRRINYPYWPGQGKSHPLVADRIKIILNGQKFSEELFLENAKTLQDRFDANRDAVSLSFVMKPITDLLGGTVTSFETEKKSDKYFIRPCIDDRMFVCCLVCDPKFAERVKGNYSKGHEYAYLRDCDASVGHDERTVSSALYRFLFIENSVSCNSATMRKALLRDSVYDRWINWGTVYGVTHHSLVCVTGLPDVVEDSVINPFITTYIHMARMALVQRASLLALEAEASALAESFAPDRSVNIEQLERISKLHEKYVKSQNQILLHEVTAQEQGVELFDMLQKQLYIGRGKQELNSQLQNLYSIANINFDRLQLEAEQKEAEADRRRERVVYRVGFVALFWAIMQVLPSILKLQEGRTLHYFASDGLILAAAAIVITIIIWRFVVRNKPRGDRHGRRK